MVMCMCLRAWGDADREADEDERQASIVTSADEGNEKDNGKDKGKSGKGRNSVQIVVEGISANQAPAGSDSVDAIAVPEAEPVKRTENLFIDGGLLLTEVMRGDRKQIRRLELDPKECVLSWPMQRLFYMGAERVKLKEARLMCTGKLVKIGVPWRKEFFTFEACDEAEAEAVVSCLVEYCKGDNKDKENPGLEGNHAQPIAA